MKLAICQFQTRWEEPAENRKAAREYIAEASEQKADLIVFPELSFTGFTMNPDFAEGASGQTGAFLEECAKEYQLGIGAGYAAKYQGKMQNRYRITGKKGETVLDYAKLHPFSFAGEDRFYQGGESLATGMIEGVSVGVQICFDLRFPEPFQKLADQAHLILVPANWPQKRRNQWLSLLCGRAIETQCYIAGINCVGKIGNLTYSGDSCLISPIGEVLMAAGEERGNRYITFTDDVEERRETFPVRRDRRPELYTRL